MYFVSSLLISVSSLLDKIDADLWSWSNCASYVNILNLIFLSLKLMKCLCLSTSSGEWQEMAQSRREEIWNPPSLCGLLAVTTLFAGRLRINPRVKKELSQYLDENSEFIKSINELVTSHYQGQVEQHRWLVVVEGCIIKWSRKGDNFRCGDYVPDKVSFSFPFPHFVTKYSMSQWGVL